MRGPGRVDAKYFLVSIALAAAILLFDLSLPLGVAGGIPYVVLVLIGLWTPGKRYVLGLAAIATVLTVLGYFYSPSGGVAWVVLSNRALAVFAIWITALLIAYRKQAEMRLRRLSRAVEQSPASVIVTDTAGNIEYVNPKFTELTGYAPEEVIGRNPRILKSGHTSPEGYRELWASITSGREWRGELHNKKKNGELFWESVSISPIRDADGKITNFLAVKEDITERKRAETEQARLETQLRQAQKMEAVGTLAGGIAHDLNNTLVPVLGLVELTLEEAPADSLARANLEMVIAAAERSKDLVNQILAFSRQDAPERKPVKLCRVIKETLSFLRASLPRTVEIRQKLDETLGPVLADATQIHQILLNLGSNAGDAMGLKGGVLEVVLERAEVDEGLASSGPTLRPGPHAKIVVSDTGAGMDEKTLERIFDPFFTTKSVGEGTGMGLSVVHGIVESHDGAITVTSEAGRGTSFEIYLPVSKRKEIDEPSMAKDVNPALAV
jgi:PAS domain S-box-containing protein